nr:response regulator transcription factor [Actinomycetota bacterium]
LVPFRGQCLVHRAQILALNGAWQEAMTEVRLACRRLSVPPGQPAAGAALYEQAELHRLRGELTDAEDAYRRAGACGHETQPGLALLRLVQGRADTAWAGIRRALEEPRPAWDRPRLLAAAAEVALARRDAPAARAASEELDKIAEQHDTDLLHAMAAQTSGSVLLAEGDQRAALNRLRLAWRLWQDLDAPYECARVRLLQGRCCQGLGDLDAAQMELQAAAEVFRALGAAPDLAGLETRGVFPTDGQSLTPREVQVLRTVATGKTNRAIAEDLFLSEKTVARHLSNIFTKLDVSSRAAATAYAYEHDLL